MFSFTTSSVIISLRYGSNIKENIICTEDDIDFALYNDKVNDRKVRFKIKDILKDHWDNFINKYKRRYLLYLHRVLKTYLIWIGNCSIAI